MSEFYILCYHKIGDVPKNTKYPGLYVSEKNFNSHINILKTNGFNFLTLTEFEKIYKSLHYNKFINTSISGVCSKTDSFAINKKADLFNYFLDSLKLISTKRKIFKKKACIRNNHKKYAVITFDDGSESLYKNAFKILKSNDVKATIFIISDLIGGINEWDTKNGEVTDRLLSQEQIKEMAEYGVEIGAHSRTHPHLTEIPLEKTNDEIVCSKKKIENLFDIKVNFFAYPYGDLNKAIKNIAEKAGFIGACSTKCGIVKNNADFFELPRIDMRWNTYLFKLKRLIFKQI